MKLNSFFRQIQEGLQPFVEQIRHVKYHVNKFVKENPELIKTFKFILENGTEIFCEIWKEGAKYGWFINWYTPGGFDNSVLDGKEAIDKFMINHINEDIADIEEKLVSLYPKRSQIITNAFNLHRNKNYIASIPLLMSQTDGIVAQNIGSYLFTEHDKRGKKLKETIDNLPEEFERVFWAPITANTQFSAGISKSKPADKEKAPNRSGIMHGSRKHLDYGTEINSLKCISLLAYVAFVFNNEVA